jgi:3-oxoacyl-[acyl-carrier-protein] synthase II
MERVVVTGIGLITPVGIGKEEPWKALLAGESGVAPITLFDATPHRTKIAAEVKGWDPLRFIEKKKVKEMGRFCEFSFAAGALAMKDAGLDLTDEEREETGCFVGVGLGGVEQLENAKAIQLTRGANKISPYMIPSMIANLAAGQLSIAYGLKGPSYCNTSACSSSAHSLGEAFEWIRRGRAKVMVAGGAEGTITEVGVGGFEAMRALSTRNEEPKRASRPWDKDRDGFVVGEGAGILILESLTRAKKRGAHIYAELRGYGATSDGYHITQPAPGGEGAVRSMRMAIKDAGLSPDNFDYVNAHGTSTGAGDLEEAKAVATVFGSHALSGEPGKKLWVSSTKSMTGHLLGAAGVLEAAICAMAITDGRVPPTINLDNLDPGCLPLDFVPHTARDRRVQHVLSNSFGFGGTNASLVLSRFEG